ncbi:MAG: hypothetical protein K1000chlam4_00553 [Chlamydiae bacterium]|nr:hypothetical protein [Chlamydiota bacterium]
MTAAASISNFTPKSLAHIAGSIAYVAVPGVSFCTGAARTVYAVRNLIHHYKINKRLSGEGGIHDFLESDEGKGLAEARECLTITDAQKQAKLDVIRATGKYRDDQLEVPLVATCMKDVKAASNRMTVILLKELARGLSEILFPFVGPLLWTMKDIHDTAPESESANLFGCHQVLESWKWNAHLYPIAQGLEHPKEL